MELILGLLGVIAALVGAFFFQRSKAQTNEAINENLKTKEELLKVDEKVVLNNSSLKQEEITRNQLREDIKKEQNEESTPGDILEFFNKRK